MEPWKRAEMHFESVMAGSYDFHYYSSPVSRAHLREFFRLVRRYADREHYVLDVGGGTGAVSEQLWRHGYRRVIMADLSLAMLREAKKKVPAVVAIVCDGEHLPFKDDAVRTIVCSAVLHHLPFPERMLGDLRRVLSPYGLLVAQEPNQDHLLTKPRFSQLSGLCMGLVNYLYRIERYEPVSEPPIHEYHRAFTRQEMVTLFSDQLYILDFRSRFAFSCLFAKLRSPFMARLVLAVDRLLRRNEGSSFYVTCSKAEPGHRNLLKYYFRYLERLRQDPDRHVPGLFVMSLFPLIVLGRLYERYQRIRARLGKAVY
jgi:ubiquinone/menaquinone biosynthesis C-methylase UbiE